MRTLRTITLSALLAAALPAWAAAQSFEGTLRQRMVMLGPEQLATLMETTPGERPDPEQLFAVSPEKLLAAGTQMESTISFKGRRLRIDLPALEGASMGYMLVDSAGGNLTMVMPAMRRAMVMSPSLLAASLPNMDELARAKSPEEMARRELGALTIDGIGTVGWEATDGESITRSWAASRYEHLATALASLGSLLPGMPVPPETATAASDERGFPIRTQSLAPIGEDQSAMLGAGWAYVWMEVLSIEEKPLEDAFFAIPEGMIMMQMPGGA